VKWAALAVAKIGKSASSRNWVLSAGPHPTTAAFSVSQQYAVAATRPSSNHNQTGVASQGLHYRASMANSVLCAYSINPAIRSSPKPPFF
jgi:hypothetical protein